MQRTTKTATLSRFKTQLRAAVVGVGVLFTSTPTMVAGDGVYRSLSSGDVTYANPIDLGISSSFSDQATQASGIQVMDGMYVSTSAEPGAAYPAIPSPTQGVAVDQPMVFRGTPVLHNSMPGYASGALPANCCMGCDRRYFVNYDAVWFKRNGDEGFSLSRGTFMDEFDYDFAGRYTIGQQFDCVDGVEASFMGPLNWTRAIARVGTGLDSFLVPGGLITAANIDAFDDSRVHTQIWRAQLQNYEFNRRWWAGDILSSFVGVRAVQYKEQYGFDAVAADGVGLGIYRRNVENFLLGGHIGGDMAYPLSQRMSVAAKGRMGVFANFNQGQAFLSNRGTVRVNAFDKDTDIAGIIETGSSVRYRVLRNVVASAGYEFWYLLGVATVPRQAIYSITPATGNRVSAADEVFFHGATAGLEVSF